MEFARIPSVTARRALFPLMDEDITAMLIADDATAEAAELDSLIAEELGPDFAEIDALVDQAERDFAAAEQVESFRVSRELTDQVRARRAARRAARESLRSLPGRFDTAGEVAA
ncbi:hypothetical protein GCM10027445_50580 [Amycolatopsis endophytica]|uniref:Uncharacterized protein n=1 Tax=Amycolatopsis endophytica TaxID=860233 RepID=A0A853AYR8_9PSEU|nr:hypothetical protein [Amycolatopsis endophytica]NYI87868.1 hypothetical protein [Amycolatopsis endophytica]